jgi:sterol 3beta-glucosyltransferase
VIVSILAIGSRGDVQPPAALAVALAERGHEARLIAPAAYVGLVAGSRVDFRPISVDVQAEFMSDATRGLFQGGGSLIAYAKWLLATARRITERITPEVRDHTKGSEVIVGAGYMQSQGLAAAELWGARLVSIWFWPGIASEDFLCSLTGPMPVDLPKWLNRALFIAGDQIVWMLARPLVNQMRLSLELPPRGLSPDLRRSVNLGVPLLLPYSEALLPRSGDWPANVLVTGYWRLERPTSWRPPEALSAFLDAGSPPLYVGFGSMALAEPKATMSKILAAVARANARAVISAGWGGLQAQDVGGNICLIDEAPHDWLFPKMAAIVHHAGAGTTGAALHAGKPSVAVPFILDQFFWGAQLHKRGVAPPPIPHKRLTSQKLAEAIVTAVSDPNMRASAEALGERVRAEDGLARAITAIERAPAIRL